MRRAAYGKGTLVNYTPIDSKHRIEVYHQGDRNFLYYPAYYSGKHWFLYSDGKGGQMAFGMEDGARLFFENRARVKASKR